MATLYAVKDFVSNEWQEWPPVFLKTHPDWATWFQDREKELIKEREKDETDLDREARLLADRKELLARLDAERAKTGKQSRWKVLRKQIDNPLQNERIERRKQLKSGKVEPFSLAGNGEFIQGEIVPSHGTNY